MSNDVAKNARLRKGLVMRIAFWRLFAILSGVLWAIISYFLRLPLGIGLIVSLYIFIAIIIVGGLCIVAGGKGKRSRSKLLFEDS